MIMAITELTKMVVAQNMATLGNPERDQRGPTAIWNESQMAFRACYGLPEIINGVARD
jgi:hypothetical protein